MTTTTSTATPSTASVPTLLWVGLGGTILAILGSFLPWVKTPLGNVAGTSGDGVLVLIAGVIAGGALGYAITKKEMTRKLALALLIPAVLMIGVSIYDLLDVRSAASSGLVRTGYGLYLCALGSAVATAIGGLATARGIS